MYVCFFFDKCYHHFLKKNDSLRNGIDLTNSLKTEVLVINGKKFCVKNIFHYGAAVCTQIYYFYICAFDTIDDALHLICLLNNGKFDIYSLPNGGKVLDGVSLLEYVMGDT